METKKFNGFKEFYPFYLAQHSDSVNRALHFIGASVVILLALSAILSGKWFLFWLCLPARYGFAWTGHFLFEENRPATFKHPLYSLIADFAMWWDLLMRKIKF